MRRKTRSISIKDCYAILGVSKDASLDDVKHAYRRKAFELHPDLNPDDPNAGKKFQFLNEAYVALSALLQNQEQSKEQEKQEQDASAQTESAKKEETKEESKKTEEEQKEQKKREQADKAYAEQDVLRDLLNDPFARRVFEDIYSELNKQQAGKKEEPETKKEEPTAKSAQKAQAKEEVHPSRKPSPKPKERPHTILHKGNIAWDTPKWDTNKGVGGFVKNWFKRQIDEELTLTLPAASLVPGRKVRLQIRHGISNDIHTIEVTIPPDFALGKPIRLRGLGKHVGPWQGDLYLILESS